jgi:hypothetical protein
MSESNEPEVGGLLARWWRRYWRGGAAALVALTGLGLVTMGPAGVAAGLRDYTQRQAATAAARQHLIGTEVRDGPVTFVVHQIQCGAAQDETANGQLCQVTIGARNDGDEEVTVPGTEQLLYGTKGARHRSVTGESEPFGTIAPGEAAAATIPFDLPPGWVATHVEVHATPYTRGQVVAIGGRPLPLPS